MQPQTQQFRTGSLPAVAMICLSGLLAGCGVEAYEERLQATSEFNQYIQTMEANLVSPIWENAGIKMRVPQPFDNRLAPPPIVENEEGEKVYGPDRRHPTELIGVMLPGILDAWQATLPGDGGADVESRFYVLSNQYRFRKVDGAYVEDPSQFFFAVEAALAIAFEVIIPEGEANVKADNIRYLTAVPPPKSLSSRFSTIKEYVAVRFVATDPNSEQKLQAQLYEYTAGDLQVAIVVIGPQAFTPRFQQRLDLALQTLTVDENAQSGSSPSGRSGGSRGLGF